jgi:hypothetical protein
MLAIGLRINPYEYRCRRLDSVRVRCARHYLNALNEDDLHSTSHA